MAGGDANAQTRAELKIVEHPKLGPYLTAGGASVYLFEEDRPEASGARWKATALIDA
jgi:hypothetical protein